MNTNTHFQKVLEFNRAFNIATKTKPSPEVLQENERLIKYRLSLVKEEFEELKQAVKDKNFTEIIDALADIEYVVLGFYTALGINADEAFDIVHKSNMSKLCMTEEEARYTVVYYLENKHLGYDSPKYKLSDDGQYYIVYNESTSKILKSVNYTPAKFDKLVNPKNVRFAEDVKNSEEPSVIDRGTDRNTNGDTVSSVKNTVTSFFNKFI